MRPEFDRFDSLGRRFEAERVAALAALRPQAAAVFRYGLDASAVRADQRGYVAFVAVGLPVFDWFQARGLARQSRYRRDQVEADSAASARAFAREYASARAAVRSSFQRLPPAGRALEDARQNARLSRLLYESGEGLALDVLVAQSQLRDAGAAYYSTLAEYEQALIAVEAATAP